MGDLNSSLECEMNSPPLQPPPPRLSGKFVSHARTEMAWAISGDRYGVMYICVYIIQCAESCVYIENRIKQDTSSSADITFERTESE